MYPTQHQGLNDAHKPSDLMWQSGTMPMYSPVWTNEKPWLQRFGSNLVMTIEDMKNTVVHLFSPSHRRSHRTLTTAPNNSTGTFVLMCGLWYMSSALSSNTGKAILNQFRYPITLTFVQFGFVAGYCLLCMSPLVQFTTLRKPTRKILQSTFPMGLFQVAGHIFSSIAISRIPVSTVHTIKALSPLFTVAAYALLFGVSYSSKTYISLLPLTLGVMLACSFDMSASNAVGLLSAFGSAVIFVSSNIFFKKIMPTNSGTTSHKLDKLNLLLYSSGMAFVLMIPIWMYYDLPTFLSGSHHLAHAKEGRPPAHSVSYYFFMNGTVHYAQNIIAFIILSSTSPVTYSIASLIKRVAVICIAIVWFAQRVHPVQAFGILLTFTGLYMYNNAKSDVEKGEKKVQRLEAVHSLALPTTKEEARLLDGTETPPDKFGVTETTGLGSGAYARARGFSLSANDIPFQNGYAHQRPTQAPPTAHFINVMDTRLQTMKEEYEPSRRHSYPSPPPSVASHSPPMGTTVLPEAVGYAGMQDRSHSSHRHGG
ncbi:TPT-domain-containing protein [Coprinopsis marcescibilis]|uniref:TPT-domain-containing protein n=1 Tax=Coprinopsis marcescibilis TaxID=230819 RepID=A0A5C3L0F4_COPMA|nr:TPT-domain-containing protein [Coprinopsis marcescibilis]